MVTADQAEGTSGWGQGLEGSVQEGLGLWGGVLCVFLRLGQSWGTAGMGSGADRAVASQVAGQV